MFTLALLNDIADYAGSDLVLMRIPDLITAGILGTWMFSKGVKATSPTTRYLTALVVELTPFLGDVSPAWTIAVLITYYKQKNGIVNKAMNIASKKAIPTKK
tara:strand:+ start:890 stop:1195 length:306 start_codon:yes stop_codon:yes gene_type:complete